MGGRVKTAAKEPESESNTSIHKEQTYDSFESMNSPVGHIIFLQRTIGNQAAQRLFYSGVIQAKLKIGQPGDKYEQDADRVADTVMIMPEPGIRRESTRPFVCGSKGWNQDIAEKDVQAKSLYKQVTPLVQHKDEEDIQTKPVAEQITSIIQRQPEEEDEIQTKALPDQFNPLLKRQEGENETVQRELLLQRQTEKEEKEIALRKPGIQPHTDDEEKLHQGKCESSEVPQIQHQEEEQIAQAKPGIQVQVDEDKELVQGKPETCENHGVKNHGVRPTHLTKLSGAD